MEMYVHHFPQIPEVVNKLEGEGDASHVIVPAAAVFVPDRDDQARLGDVLEYVGVRLEDEPFVENRIQVFIEHCRFCMAFLIDHPLVFVPLERFLWVLLNQEDVRIGVLAFLPSNIMGRVEVDHKLSFGVVEADFDGPHVLALELSSQLVLILLLPADL